MLALNKMFIKGKQIDSFIVPYGVDIMITRIEMNFTTLYDWYEPSW